MILYKVIIAIVLALLVQSTTAQNCWNHGGVIGITRYSSSILYKVCLHGVVQSKLINRQSTGCLHIPHSLVRVTGSKFQHLKDNECVGEDGKARQQGYGVVLGQKTLKCIPVLFEYCGTPQLDACCENVHNIKGPYSCLVYTVKSLSLKQKVLLNTGHQYFHTTNQQNRKDNLVTSIQKVVQTASTYFYGYSSGRKRTSYSLFADTKLEWL